MEISVILADANGSLITGAAASTALIIRRVADGFLLDWADLTFKAAAWGTLATTLTEVDATNLPGEYRKDVTVTAWNDGFYQAMVHFDDATTVLNFSGEKYIYDGIEVDADVGLIKAKTDNLPSDPADESLLEAAIDEIPSRIFVKIP